MSQKINPLADRIVVKVKEAEEKTASGILLPDTISKEKPMLGEVIAVGPGKVSDNGQRVAPEVKVGDTILFGKYSPTEVQVEGEDYLILREDDILAIVS